jgi:DNA-binding PadR family transcriptional regulator
MNEKLAEIIANSPKALEIFKDEKTLEAIIAIKETFIDKFLERGDIRLLVLDSLNKDPKHGYQIMTSISKMFNELYRPSPGVIYPTLQSLTEENLITYEERGKKKIYTLTKNGEKELKRDGKRLDGIINEFEAAHKGGDDEFIKKMEGVVGLWMELAYNIFFKTKTNYKDNKIESEKRLKKIEVLLKKTVNEAKEI